MSNDIYSRITVDSVTTTLAYIQNYTPNYLPGRCLTVSHLRHLSNWLGCPGTPRSLRQHPFLAGHIALLMATDFISHQEKFWFLMPQAMAWLNKSYKEQVGQLLEPFESCQLKTNIQKLKLEEVLPIDAIAFYQQQLSQQRNCVLPTPQVPFWESVDKAEWRLCLPSFLPSSIKFHLLQYGEWLPGEPLCITPRSVAKAAHQGYGPMHICYQIEKA